ncbi:hypothetical protein L345_14257, partial [Ophiophagus hannah]
MSEGPKILFFTGRPSLQLQPGTGPSLDHRPTGAFPQRISSTSAEMRAEEGACRAGKRSPCLLVALRPANLEAEREQFFRSSFAYNPQFEYGESVPEAVLEKYREASGQFLVQATGIINAVLQKYGTYENFEASNGGKLLTKCQIWSITRKYMQKEGCSGEVVVQLTEDLLSQAVMMVENSRPTLAINLSGARQNWLEGMLRHEIAWSQKEADGHRASKRFAVETFPPSPLPSPKGPPSHLVQRLLAQSPLQKAPFGRISVVPGKRGGGSEMEAKVWLRRLGSAAAASSSAGCFSKDQVYLEGILQILRHRQTIDFQLLAALGKVSYEDVDHLKKYGVLEKARIPHFMQDLERYMQQLNHIVATNCLSDEELEQLMPE